MDCHPAQPVSTGFSFAWRPTQARLAAIFCGILLVAPLFNDIVSPHINMSILYLVPLLFCAWLGNRNLLRRTLVLSVLLTYVGLAARMWIHPNPNWRWGLLNRSFVVASLIIAYFILDAVLRQLQALVSWRPARTDAEESVIEEIIFSAQRFAAIVAAMVLAIGLFVVDLVTPGQINFPILYIIPLLLIVWTRSHLWLWVTVGLLVVFAVVGWYGGEGPTGSSISVRALLTNRLIAITVLIIFGLIIQIATSPYQANHVDEESISHELSQ